MKATPVATRPPRLFGTPRAREVAAHQKAKKQVQTAKRRNDAGFLDAYGQTPAFGRIGEQMRTMGRGCDHTRAAHG